jgi:hypothetical protein
MDGLLDKRALRPRLEVVETESFGGRYLEVYDGGHHQGTYHTQHNGAEFLRRYAGRIALVYTWAAYEAECALVVDADPDGFDLSDVVPRPVLALVRPPMQEA